MGQPCCSPRPLGKTPDIAADSGELHGRVAIVTGAGRGIGAAHAVALAAAGAMVVVNDNGVDLAGAHPDPDVARRCAESICAAGGHAVSDVSDVSDFSGAGQLVRRAVDEFGRLDILVNNAGIIGTGTELERLSEDELQSMLAVHVVGTIGTICGAFPIMRTRLVQPFVDRGIGGTAALTHGL
jgi:NAD(P)-dependent dehydrogenase (short-subunit alcohol dehydrogenase family)